MNILSFGSRCITAQIDRIEDGFRSLGHIVNKMDMSPDLIYANDIGHWDEALAASSDFPSAKLILTILDLPFHLEEDVKNQIEKVKSVIKAGAIICTISNKVREDVAKHCNYDCAVIYQPIKDVKRLGVKWEDRPIEYLIVGRNTDENKGHYDVTIPVIQKMHGDIGKLHTVGEGFVGAQNYGNVTDEQLNVIYNNSKFVFCPSKFEGLGLQQIEAMAVGAIPISYHWHPTSKDFLPKELIFSDNQAIIDFIQKTNKNPEGKEFFKFYQNFFDKFRPTQIAQNIVDIKNGKVLQSI